MTFSCWHVWMLGCICLACGALQGAEPVSSTSKHLRISKLQQDLALPVVLPQVLKAVTAPPRGNRARRLRYVALLQRLGAAEHGLVQTRVPQAKADSCNVLVTCAGQEPNAGVLVIGAHTDAVSTGQGAVDNWTGSIMLAALYDHFRRHPTRHTLLFAAFASEEHGCQGSRHFVRSLSRQDRRQIRAMVNLECLGVGALRTWTNRSADALESLCVQAGRETGIPVRRDALFGYSSDASNFHDVDIPAVTVHSLGPGDLHIINGPLDTVARIDRTRYRRAFRLLAHFIRLLDQQRQVPSSRDRERGWRPAPQTLFDQGLNDAEGRGVRIASLAPHTAEHRAGIRSGDILRCVDEIPVHSRQELLPILLTLHRGSRVTLLVRRTCDGEAKDLRVKVSY